MSARMLAITAVLLVAAYAAHGLLEKKVLDYIDRNAAAGGASAETPSHENQR